jgi:hypothetical protein
MFEQLVFVNFKSTKAFTELYAPLNVAFLIVGQLVLLIFLHCERKPLQIYSVTDRSRRLFPLCKRIGLTGQLIPLADGRFHSCCPNKIPKKSSLHLDHRLLFVIPEHRLSFLYLRRYVLEPLVARLGSPNSGVANLDHITYLIRLVSLFALLTS